MSIIYLLDSYIVGKDEIGRPDRTLSLAFRPEFNGLWAESEIDNNEAVIRIDATDNQLKRLKDAGYREISEAEASTLIATRPRLKPRYDRENDRVILDGAVVASTPLATLKRLKPDRTALGGGGTRTQIRLDGHLPPIRGAAFPSVGILDDFNRADDADISGDAMSSGLDTWAATPAWGLREMEIISNRIVSGSSTIIGYQPTTNTYSRASVPIEIYATQAAVGNDAKTRYMDWCGTNHSSGTPDCYYIRLLSGAVRIRRYDDGIGTTLGSEVSTTTSSAGVQWGIQHDPDGTIHLFKDGTELTTRSDNTYTSGTFAIGEEGQVNPWDNFGGGEQAAAGATVTVSALLEEVTAALNVNKRYLTTIDADHDEVTAALNVNQSYLATIGATHDEVQASLNAVMQPSTRIVAVVDELLASLALQQSQLVTVGAVLDEVQCSITLSQRYLTTIDSDLDEATASLSVVMQPTVTIAALLDEAVAALAAGQSQLVSIDADLDETTAALIVEMLPEVTIAALLDEVVASLAVDIAALNVEVTIGAVLNENTASLSLEQRLLLAIAAAQDEVSASLALEQRILATIEAAMDEAVAALSLEQQLYLTIGSTLDEAAASLTLEQRLLLTLASVLDETTGSLAASQIDYLTIVTTLAEVVFAGQLEAEIESLAFILHHLLGVDRATIRAWGIDRASIEAAGEDRATIRLKGQDGNE